MSGNYHKVHQYHGFTQTLAWQIVGKLENSKIKISDIVISEKYACMLDILIQQFVHIEFSDDTDNFPKLSDNDFVNELN